MTPQNYKIIRTYLSFHPTACLWIFFIFLHFSQEIIIESKDSWSMGTIYNFFVLKKL